MNKIDIEFHRKVLAAAYEVDELRNQDLYIEWKKKRDFCWSFCEVRLNYFEFRKVLMSYLSKTKNFHLSHTITINRNQRVLIQKFSNFLFSCDKFFDYNEINNHNSELHSFFIQLRNFVAHKSQFPLISVLSFQKSENKRFETFSKKEILEYLDDQILLFPKRNGLKSARNFSLRLEEKPDILPLVDKYFKLIEDDFTRQYLDFFKKNKLEFEFFFQKVSDIKDKNRKLNVMGIVPPLRDSEIRLIQYLIKKSSYI
jgi:hypothetical protein